MPRESRNLKGLGSLHQRVRYWLGEYHDLDAVDAVLAAVAVERLEGEPFWLLVLDAASTGKTETVSIASQCEGVECVSTFTSDAGLLSGTPRDESSDQATGGLMRVLEPNGIMLIKDVTSILSLGPIERAKILAAFRDIYDGDWWRISGGEGGQKLEWHGRIGVIGAVTTAWDKHYAAISSMGDRFMLIRTSSTENRIAKGMRAIQNNGYESQMRTELTTLVTDLIGRIPRFNDPHRQKTELDRRVLSRIEPTAADYDRLVKAADLVTQARTAVEFDRFRRDIVHVDDLEGPQRFAKQLGQLVKGARLIGRNRTDAMTLGIRCARDCIPPIRLAVMEDLNQNGKSNIADVAKRLGKPRTTVKRGLETLAALGICVETAELGSSCSYSIAEGIEVGALAISDPQHE